MNSLQESYLQREKIDYTPEFLAFLLEMAAVINRYEGPCISYQERFIGCEVHRLKVDTGSPETEISISWDGEKFTKNDDQ